MLISKKAIKLYRIFFKHLVSYGEESGNVDKRQQCRKVVVLTSDFLENTRTQRYEEEKNSSLSPSRIQHQQRKASNWTAMWSSLTLNVESSTYLEDFALQIQQPAVLRYTFGLWNENISFWWWFLFLSWHFWNSYSSYFLFLRLSVVENLFLRKNIWEILSSNSFFSSYFLTA